MPFPDCLRRTMNRPPRTFIALTACAALSSCQSVSTGPSGIPRVDLTSLTWFPPIVRQQGNSCAQQAGLYYLLSAERNRQHFLSSWQPNNRFSPYQTYAILADSMDGGSHVTDGWHLAREMGVPRETDLPSGSRNLMHGFDKYVRTARIRPTSWDLLPLRTASDVRAIQKRLAAGHPVACDFQVRDARITKLADGSSLVTSWGRTGPGHTMIYAGYDETIGQDINGDGQLTNDRDLDGDGRISLADWERGAFLVVNPWGPSWGTRGRAWALMREHAVSSWPRAHEVATLTKFQESLPRVMLRISLALQDRSALTLTVSDGRRTISPLPFNSRPLALSSSPASAWEVFGKVHRPGPILSPAPLTNPTGGPLEMGLNLPDLNPARPVTLTLSSNGRPLQGTLHSAAIVELDPVGRITRETALSGLPTVIPPPGGSWTTSR